MKKLLLSAFVAVNLVLQGCATGHLLDHYAGSPQYQRIKTPDRIVAIGQTKTINDTQGMLFLGERHSYLITDGAPELMAIITQLPAEQRLLTSVLPITFKVQNTPSKPNFFSGHLTFRYHLPTNQLDQATKVKLEALGFKQQILVTENGQQASYPQAFIGFDGRIYDAVAPENIQHKMSQAYPIELEQFIRIDQKNSTVKNATGLLLTPLALAFDIATLPIALVVAPVVVGYSITQPDAWK